jgi:hypothetical protein
LPRFSGCDGSREKRAIAALWFIQKNGVSMLVRSLVLALALLSAPIAVAQTPTPRGDLSDKALATLKALAWQSLPSKIVQSDNRVIEIDKSDPSKIIIPDADAREVIRAANLTARAHKCELQELVIANRDILLLREKKTGKWTESQLQYINTLHLFTVQLMVGKVELVDEERVKQDFDPKTAPMPPANTKTCNDKEKQDILSAVEANEKLLGKS